MRKSLSLLLLLLAISAATFQPTRITVVGDLGEVPRSALTAAGVACHQEEGSLTLEIWEWQRPAAVTALARAYNAMGLAKRVVESNMANRDVTRTADGTPYRRRFMSFTPEGGAGEILQDDTDFNWVYSPGHPDALVEGCHAGYVAKPNINVLQEQMSWRNFDQSQHAVRQVMEKLDPAVVFSQTPACPRQEATGSLAGPNPVPYLKSVPPTVLAGLDPRGREGFRSTWQVPADNPLHSGQASVACALNWLSGERRFLAGDIDSNYGFALLDALKSESAPMALDWRDAGNLTWESWPAIERTLAQSLPVLVAYRDPHNPDTRRNDRVVMLVRLEGDKVIYADSDTGRLACIDRQTLTNAPAHPDGNFVFLPTSRFE